MKELLHAYMRYYQVNKRRYIIGHFDHVLKAVESMGNRASNMMLDFQKGEIIDTRNTFANVDVDVCFF